LYFVYDVDSNNNSVHR